MVKRDSAGLHMGDAEPRVLPDAIVQKQMSQTMCGSSRQDEGL